MTKILAYLKTINLKKIAPYWLLACLVIPVIVFVLPKLRESAKIKLGSPEGLNITADRQDSLGAFTDTKFTLRSDTDLKLSDLKNNLEVLPEIDFDIQSVSPRQFTITPRTALQDNNIYKIQVKTDQKVLSWAFQTKDEFRVVNTLPRDKATYVPLNTGIEIYFSHANWDDLDKNFTITPDVPGSFERHNRTLSFVPKSLQPGTLYTVKIKKGIRLKGSDEVLKEDYTFQFETTEDQINNESLSFSKSLYEFSVADKPAFGLYSSRNDGVSLNVTLYKYNTSTRFLEDLKTKISLPTWSNISRKKQTFSVQNLTRVTSFDTTTQKQGYSSYFIFPEAIPAGQYLVEVATDKQKIQTLIQVTDISAFLTQSGTKTIVWANTIGSGALPNAKVTYNGRDQITNSEGLASFDTTMEDLSAKNSVISLSHPNGTLYIPVIPQEDFGYSGNDQADRRLAEKYWSYLYLDRPTYLPGDYLNFWGLLQDRDTKNKKLDLTVEISRSDFNSWDYTPISFYKNQIKTSDIGTFTGGIDLKNYSPGWYNLDIKVSGVAIISTGFSVENYVKPAFQITSNLSQKAIFAGDSVTISGEAKFFEGSPISKLSLKETGKYESPNYFTADENGKYSFTSTPVVDQGSDYSPNFRYFYISPVNPEEAMITTSNSLAVFKSSNVFVYPNNYVKNGQGIVEVDLRRVDLSRYSTGVDIKDVFPGAAGQAVKATISRTQWNKREVGTYYDFINKKTYPKYEYDQVTTQISETVLTTDNNGKATHTISVPDGESYNIRYEVTDEKGRVEKQTIYLYGYLEQRQSDSYPYVRTDKIGSKNQSYQIGETVNLSLGKESGDYTASPEDQFIYILSQRGIRSVHHSKDGRFSFKYPEEFSPNVYVRVIHFTGKTYNYAGDLYLSFDTEPKKLRLGIYFDKPVYEPADTAKISVITKNSTGMPVASEVNLNLTDEAYYSLYPEVLNPLGAIYKGLSSDIVLTYLSHQYPIEPGGAEGGGCFLPGTKILMSDGSSVNIEDLRTGDQIKTKKNTTSSELVNTKIINTSKHLVSEYLVINHHLQVTPEHNLYINGRWMTAKEIKIGDSFLNIDSQYQLVSHIEQRRGLVQVYNLTTDIYHTFFANGVYVHNEKGGSLFKDTAYFGTLKTNALGQGSVEVKLPDNLTSWRVSAQAVTADLEAGSDTTPLTVRLPFFVSATLSTQYLVGDDSVVYLRSFGDALKTSDQVNYQVDSETLNLHQSTTSNAFDTVSIKLGKLPIGKHQISFKGSSANHSYLLQRTVEVVSSRLRLTQTSSQTLAETTQLSGSKDGFTNVTFSDQNIGRHYPSLLKMSQTWGDRLDQKLVRYYSQEMIKKYFDQDIVPESVNANLYQTSDGGLSLYPYSGSDLEISAFMVNFTESNLNMEGIKNYFYKELSAAKDINTASQALFGISGLGEPVLVQINNLLDDPKVNTESQIYLGLSLAQIGDTERARSLYQSILAKHQKLVGDDIYIQTDDNKDSMLLHTALMADLASILNEKEADRLLRYLQNNQTQDLLLISHELYAVKNLLQNTKPQEVSFSYELGGNKKNVKLSRGQAHKIILLPEDLVSIKFSDISGQIGVYTSYQSPEVDSKGQVDKGITVSRSYTVNGKLTNQFDPNDLVKVTLTYTQKDTTQDGCYQITDLLPSGLRPITSPYIFGLSNTDVTYPYSIDGQKVSFCVYKGSLNKPLSYYARVVNSGTFKAEGAMIQSQANPSIYNFSDSGQVVIK